ncbi:MULTISPECIES: N(4)-(beta-N-acetylglucosaminyl)-L-asparaginase [Dyella]|uniref:Twin-arginine translocation signal domain-containing protein n=2 Tax=Dyella TaxID=231454 RepID=A0A4R0Z096_9GAMM|nr:MULTISPECIES: N(4)-(beta-N-acetylglucosaminyl)-L-asparaginase [Dyella]TBR39650.1 twin-arginine translocation signal domain-containing protein [Dyella terrae]TCI12768.1 twin-arginine translocation signal domain-containing protein [Dyella soli]
MANRRNFLKASLLGASAMAVGGKVLAAGADAPAKSGKRMPRVISTWDFGVPANLAAWQVLASHGHALDAVEKGVQVPEADLKNHSVGRAGYPDRDGHVSLDASIMDADGRCGAVAALENIAHPISVARRVMERTPHVLLVGEGALQFAVEQGFKKEKLLTPESEAAWKEWQKTAHYQPVANSEVRDYGKKPDATLGLPGGKDNHDTIGMLAIDEHGRLAGACTTSGMAWKLRGRVGDSPIIGAGLYVDGEVGAATSTGVGEEVIRNVGSFLVVELMRQGRSPQQACEEAVMRIVKRRPNMKDLQVGFIAMNREGEIGAYAIQSGFSYAVCDAGKQDALFASKSVY